MQDEHNPKFIDQIIERTLQSVSEREDFDDDILKRLRELAKTSGLSDEKRVIEALKGPED